MAVLIGALLAILGVGVILYPFMKARLATRASRSPDIEPPASMKGHDAIYDEIRTLQLEYELGSIGEDEYNERLHDYRLQAALSLRDQDQLELESSLEDEILAARGLIGSQNGSQVCGSCGKPLALIDGACRYCEARFDPDISRRGKGSGDAGPLP